MEEKYGIGSVLGYILLLGFAAYALLKFSNVNASVALDINNRTIAAPGVSYYCNRMVTQRPQQVQAFRMGNTCQTTQRGYAPAFGPCENMPCINSEICGIKTGGV
jgi:hypothetical protein